MDTLPPTSYVSRVVALPPRVARQVFDACLVDRQHDDVLQLHGPGASTAPDLTRSWAMRSVPGELRTSRLGRPHAVELELNPWSGGRTEIGLRTVGRRRPTPRSLAAAGAVVDALCSELELRGLLALHPGHATGTTARERVAASAWL